MQGRTLLGRLRCGRINPPSGGQITRASVRLDLGHELPATIEPGSSANETRELSMSNRQNAQSAEQVRDNVQRIVDQKPHNVVKRAWDEKPGYEKLRDVAKDTLDQKPPEGPQAPESGWERAKKERHTFLQKFASNACDVLLEDIRDGRFAPDDLMRELTNRWDQKRHSMFLAICEHWLPKHHPEFPPKDRKGIIDYYVAGMEALADVLEAMTTHSEAVADVVDLDLKGANLAPDDATDEVPKAVADVIVSDFQLTILTELDTLPTPIAINLLYLRVKSKSLKTLGKGVRELIVEGLVDRPRGQRSGVRITSLGRECIQWVEKRGRQIA